MHIPRFSRPDPYGLLIFMVGVLVLCEAFVRHMPAHLTALVPFVPEGTAKRALFLIGLLLVYLSDQVARRKKNAWRLTVVLLVGLIVFTLARHFTLMQLGCYVAVLLLFVVERKSFVVQSDPDRFRRGLFLAVAQLAGAILLMAAMFFIIDQREFGRHLTTGQTIHFTFNALIGQPLPHYVHATRYDRSLIDLLRLTGIISVLVVMFNLFRPLRLGNKASQAVRARAEHVLEQYSTSSEDFFTLYPEDKHYFFYGDSFLAYTVRGGVAFVLEGARGREADCLHVRAAFAKYCHGNGWYISILHADAAEVAAWEVYDIDSLQIGSEAVIDSQLFVTETVRNKHFRYVHNRAAKDNLSVEWWQPPHTVHRLDTLHHISQAWLTNGRQEYSFIMGPFDSAYLDRCSVAVLKKDADVVAYANLIPTYARVETASIDHMRSLPGISSVTMHFLLQNCVATTYEQGYTQFNLGFVPLAKLETDTPTVTERLLSVLRKLGSRLYSSQGLEQFKGKFEPTWLPRYLAYQGGIRQLPAVVASLRQVITYKHTPVHRMPRWPIAAIVLAGLLYASFPFAWFLNRHYAFSGLTSALGGEGQPYAWFFNISDILSGALTIAVLFWLRQTRRPHNHLLRRTLDIALLSAICTSLAALIPVPHEYKVLDGQIKLSLLHDPVIVLHGLASFFNSFAFVAAAVLWAVHWRRTDGHAWRQIFVGVTLLLSTVGFVVGQMVPGLAGTIQRLFITLYATWFILFTIDILTAHRNQL